MRSYTSGMGTVTDQVPAGGCCADRSSTLTCRHASMPQSVDIAALLLDEPARLAPERHHRANDALPWIQIADNLPRHERERE